VANLELVVERVPKTLKGCEAEAKAAASSSPLAKAHAIQKKGMKCGILISFVVGFSVDGGSGIKDLRGFRQEDSRLILA